MTANTLTKATTGAMLGHDGSGTTRGYIHKLDPALIAAANHVSETIAAMLDHSSPRTGEVAV